MNRLFVAYKPSRLSSNSYLSRLKRKYGTKKAGFSGTLDPFAKGVLVIGMGSYTKLFRFLKKSPKRYRATLWLGAKSDTLDIEGIENVHMSEELEQEKVEDALGSLCGEIEYEPPIFSAKHVDGQRAYKLAREGREVILKKIFSHIYKTELIGYSHPFITFEISVSEGAYIRSLGLILARRLGVEHASLSALERLGEGELCYDEEKSLDVRSSLGIKQNFYRGEYDNLKYGRVLALEDLEIQEEGYYWLEGGGFISVINIVGEHVKYELGRIEC